RCAERPGSRGGVRGASQTMSGLPPLSKREGRGRAKRASIGVGAATAVVTAIASGQSVNLERPLTLVVGTPAGGARVDRTDGARTGRTRTELPTSGLHTAWRTPVGTMIEQAPVVDGRGTTYVIGGRGEAIALGRDGTERWRASTGATQPGPAAILANDSVVFVDGAGEAVGVRDGSVRWRVRFGRGGAPNPAPLALDDGGVVVATAHELALLDADGRERARATLGEAMTLPLVAALGKVFAITASGAVWSWAPGAPELTRVASFGSPVDGGAALADDHTLVAVTAGQLHVSAVDLRRGTTTTRAVATSGLWLGPPAVRGPTVQLMLFTPTSELAVTIDAAGNEQARTLLALHPPPVSSDGGPPALLAGPHTAPVVDAAGSFAFATAAGAIGVASKNAVELLSDGCQAPVSGGAAVTGIAPLDIGTMVAACRAGAVVAITGQKASSEK
ncbi:MAG: hypothetical protein M3O46_02090, partial [Myxococcota bacterium]|nr:hypothetical protein [Myxococcota bacterium]